MADLNRGGKFSGADLNHFRRLLEHESRRKGRDCKWRRRSKFGNEMSSKYTLVGLDPDGIRGIVSLTYFDSTLNEKRPPRFPSVDKSLECDP